MQNRKRILIALNNSKVSGIENFALTLVQNLDKDKYEFVMAIPETGVITEEFKKIGVEYFIFNHNLINPYSFKGIVKLFFFLLKNRFDVIHAQAGIIPCILGFFLGVKFRIEHRHGLDFTEELRENMSYLRIKYESVKKYFVNMTLTGCERDRVYLINKFKYNPDKVITLYNGVSDFFADKPGKDEKGHITVGTIGRLMPQKAQEYFIEMAKAIEDTNTQMNIVYEIWGDGGMYPELSALINKYNLGSKVLLKGYASDLKKTYSGFDVFVLTSQYEGIPYVILKSMSAKVPVVSTDVGGINEIIKNGVNGILVPFGDVDNLKESVLKILKNKSFKDKIVLNAYNDYKDNWTIEKTISKMDKIYNNVQ